ncbi:hypothetical protein BJY16_003911 [Actinoplanes octamycinicus]|uniref:Lipoprotein n=1 Tax=Actinoplanes octamycinicus TaxID=135948 RepID=A0A7W7GYG0_9ACTN|nr:hypothetical protein [Actinoplanes octamycinicus]MBB4740452.1 hypothetical protein [Actinoplanes octamycinicus]
MRASRIVPAALLLACLTGLAGCDSDADTTTGAAPAGSGAAAPAGSAAPAAPAGGDKELCTTLNKAASAMKGGISDAQQADGSVAAKDAKAAFAKFHKAVDEALGAAGTTEVTTAARAVADEIAKAAQAEDPIGAAADAGFAELSENLTSACQTAGVKINF